MFGHALRPISIGLVIGLLGAIAASGFLASQLFEISARDPSTLLGAVVILGGVALVFVYVPARRATQVDPVVALRSQ